MDPVLIVILVVVGILVLAAIGIYNGLVSRKVETQNAYSQIDVQLKRRYDLIPNLVETVKGYATHERETLENVVKARSAAINATGVADKAAAENQLSNTLKTLFSVAEAYPDLKANQNFLSLQEELSATENRIGFARQHYNDVVSQYNTGLMRFPANILAGMFGFRPAEFFQLDAAEAAAVHQAPKVKFKMPTTFRDLIADNIRNSFLLVVVFVLFTAVVAMVLALALMVYMDDRVAMSVNVTRSLIVGGIAMVVSMLLALGSYFQGDQMVLAVSGAKPLEHKDDPQLYNVVEEMAIAAGVPMPSVYLIIDPAPNAFATGRDPQHASIAITTGLREKLNREELQGVVAHEMSHIANYDIQLMLLMAVLIGTIVMLADVFWQMLRFGSFSSRRDSNNKDSGKGGGGVVVLVIFVVAIILAIIAPILAQIIQLAVSRQREYLADATGVQLTRNPLGLANALRKIDEDPNELKAANRGTAHLYIANPIRKFEARADSMFASHPPIEDRIARLDALVGK